MEGGEHMAVLMRADYLSGVSGADFLASDDEGDVQHGVVLALEFRLQGYTLGRTLQICLYRLVLGNGELNDSVVHCL